MTTLKGYNLNIPTSFSTSIKTNATYKLNGLITVGDETSTFDSITYSYKYSGSYGGRSCSSGPSTCLGSVYSAYGTDTGTITIGTHSWSGTNSYSSNVGSNINRVIPFKGTTARIVITGGDDVNNSQAINQIASLPGTRDETFSINLATIGLSTGIHRLQIRASDDGQTKNMSKLSGAVNYTQE